jgi:hypothetical protein
MTAENVRSQIADLSELVKSAQPAPWARSTPRLAKPDRRTDLRRKVNLVIADLIRWSVEHGDDPMLELVDEFGDAARDEMLRQADLHERRGGDS